MRVTLVLLLAGIAIYCNPTVQSLPATLLAKQTASSGANAIKTDLSKSNDVSRMKLPNKNVEVVNTDYIQHLGVPEEGIENDLRVDGDVTATLWQDYDEPGFESNKLWPLSDTSAAKILSPPARLKEDTLLTPLKYWTRHCRQLLGYESCPRPYYRALLSGRQRTASSIPADYDELLDMPHYAAAKLYAAPARAVVDADDDTYMMLTGEQDIIKFLKWAMQQLNPYQTNLTANGADYLEPGMYIWKKLNLSGRLEPTLFAEEPHYVIVRRENLKDADEKLQLNVARNSNNDPFIPPRGRKHELPDLEVLLHRYETFVPNRGKKDKIKDIFKYDDLFYPNRGKRQQQQQMYSQLPAYASRQSNWYGEWPLPQQMTDAAAETWLDDISTATPSIKAGPRMLGMQRMLGKLKRELQQAEYNKQAMQQQRAHGNYMQQLTTAANRNANNANNNKNNQHNEWPIAAANSKMSTHQINSNDQSVKQSMSAASKKLHNANEQAIAADAAVAEPVHGQTTSNLYWQKPTLLKWHASNERPTEQGVAGWVRHGNEEPQYYNQQTQALQRMQDADSWQRWQQLQLAESSLGTLLTRALETMNDNHDGN